MQWWDNGEAVLSAMGEECNYQVECEFGRGRVWKVRQDLGEILLKATWAETADAAKALAEKWEEAYVGPVCTAARSGRSRLLSAARNTRSTRQGLARSFTPEEERPPF
jgi:hypothetical protein